MNRKKYQKTHREILYPETVGLSISLHDRIDKWIEKQNQEYSPKKFPVKSFPEAVRILLEIALKQEDIPIS